MAHRDIYLKVFIGIAIWFAVVTIFGVWEYDILKAEMVLNEKLLSHDRIVEQAAFFGGTFAYIAEMVFWTLLVLILGSVWSAVLFPHRNLLEKIIFSLVFGVFVMPLSIFIPFTVITMGTVFTTLAGAPAPAFVGPTLTNIVDLFVLGHEQIYEFTNVLIFLIIGLVLLGIKRFSHTPAPLPASQEPVTVV